MSTTTIVAGGYSLFLTAFALGLDRLGRHAHHRSGRFRTQGFVYHQHLDVWQCPEGEHLRPHGLDHRQRVARYRARASVCNQCAAKGGCTDSDGGREIARPLDPWPHSEAGRFHRGISVTLVGLACLVALGGALLNPKLPDLVALGTLFTLVLATALHLARVFARTPSGFPEEALRNSL